VSANPASAGDANCFPLAQARIQLWVDGLAVRRQDPLHGVGTGPDRAGNPFEQALRVTRGCWRRACLGDTEGAGAGLSFPPNE
jgi:hypothetical protein